MLSRFAVLDDSWSWATEAPSEYKNPCKAWKLTKLLRSASRTTNCEYRTVLHSGDTRETSFDFSNKWFLQYIFADSRVIQSVDPDT